MGWIWSVMSLQCALHLYILPTLLFADSPDWRLCAWCLDSAVCWFYGVATLQHVDSTVWRLYGVTTLRCGTLQFEESVVDAALWRVCGVVTLRWGTKNGCICRVASLCRFYRYKNTCKAPGWNFTNSVSNLYKNRKYKSCMKTKVSSHNGSARHDLYGAICLQINKMCSWSSYNVVKY